jgi:hypothetical protein
MVFFILSLSDSRKRKNQRERLPTAPTQLKINAFSYEKITRFALQIFSLNGKNLYFLNAAPMMSEDAIRKFI